MSTKTFNIHFKIINIGLIFVLFLIVLSNFPHDPFSFYSWLNCSLYFIVFLQCAFLFKKVRHNKAIFFNLGAFTLVASLNFINAFVGDEFLFGNEDLWFYFYEYSQIALSFLIALAMIYICMKYLFSSLSTAHIYTLSLAVILPIFVWHFFPFLIDKDFIIYLPEGQDDLLYRKDLYFNFLPLFFVLLYGIILYKHDRSLGEHVNTIMVSLLMLNLMQVTNLVGYLYNITIFVFGQYVMFIILALMLMTMFRLVSHVNSAFGQFYDDLIVVGNHSGVPIKRKKSLTLSVLDFTKAYFQERRNAIGFLTILFIFCINYFDVSLFLRLHMAVLSTAGLIVFYFFMALTQKRLHSDNILSYKRSNI